MSPTISPNNFSEHFTEHITKQRLQTYHRTTSPNISPNESSIHLNTNISTQTYLSIISIPINASGMRKCSQRNRLHVSCDDISSSPAYAPQIYTHPPKLSLNSLSNHPFPPSGVGVRAGWGVLGSSRDSPQQIALRGRGSKSPTQLCALCPVRLMCGGLRGLPVDL